MIYQNNLSKLKQIMIDEKSSDATKKIHKKRYAYLYCIRMITNCFISSNCKDAFLFNKVSVYKDIVVFLAIFSDAQDLNYKDSNVE